MLSDKVVSSITDKEVLSKIEELFHVMVLNYTKSKIDLQAADHELFNSFQKKWNGDKEFEAFAGVIKLFFIKSTLASIMLHTFDLLKTDPVGEELKKLVQRDIEQLREIYKVND